MVWKEDGKFYFRTPEEEKMIRLVDSGTASAEDLVLKFLGIRNLSFNTPITNLKAERIRSFKYSLLTGRVGLTREQYNTFEKLYAKALRGESFYPQEQEERSPLGELLYRLRLKR